MITKSGSTQCDRCGQFIGGDDERAKTWTPYASSTETEPRDAEHECGSCVAKWGSWMRKYTADSVWIPAYLIN
jgi:hypothetical protein